MAYSGKWSRAKKEPSVKFVKQTVPEMYQSQENVSVIHASINSVDKVARDIEQRWGIGKLEKLCDPALATRFEQARQNLNYALRMENITEVVAKSQDLIRGWKIIEKKVLEAGHKPKCEKVWHMVNDEGKKYAFVNDISDHVYFDKDITVVSMEEVLRIVDDYHKDIYGEVKKHFPGAEIVSIKPKEKDKLDDKLPF